MREYQTLLKTCLLVAGMSLALPAATLLADETIEPNAASTDNQVGEGNGRNRDRDRGHTRGGKRGTDGKGATQDGLRSGVGHVSDCGDTVSLVVNGETLWETTPEEAARRLEFASLEATESRWNTRIGIQIHELLLAYPDADSVIVRGCGNRWHEFDGLRHRDKARPLYLVDNRGRKMKLVKVQGRRDTQMLKIVSQIVITSTD